MSIACTGCGQSPIPLVPIGSLRQFIEARKLIEATPQISIAVVDSSVARTGFRLFITSPMGKRALAALAGYLGVSVVAAPQTEELMREIEEFLRRQRRMRKKGRPPKGVAVPIPRRDKRVIPGPQTGPQVKEGVKRLIDAIVRPDKDDPDPERKIRKWFERRWKDSPGLAFALGFENKGFATPIKRQRRVRRRKRS